MFRLCLERSATAEEAVEVLVSLLADPGQVVFFKPIFQIFKKFNLSIYYIIEYAV